MEGTEKKDEGGKELLYLESAINLEDNDSIFKNTINGKESEIDKLYNKLQIIEMYQKVRD